MISHPVIINLLLLILYLYLRGLRFFTHSVGRFDRLTDGTVDPVLIAEVFELVHRQTIGSGLERTGQRRST